MNAINALRRLESLVVPVFETRDAAALFATTTAATNMILRRLADKGFLVHIARGRWALRDQASVYTLPEHLSAPDPAYVSLQSALYLHGMIEQVPAVTYAVTTGRNRRFPTPMGHVSLHHLPPKLFFGFELRVGDGAKIATPEKALVDLLYLSPARSRLFAQLPEVEIPKRFDWREVKRILARIPSTRRKTMVEKRLGQWQTGKRT